LLELNLSQNRVCDQGLIKLSGIFEENSCVLTRLIVHSAKITITGAAQLFDCLKHNSHLKELILSDNDLSGSNICKLQILLWNNRDLRKLDFSNCNLGREAAQAIGEGLYKNQTMASLNLSGNFLPASCMESWSSA
jgi:uncharacterized protein YjbI with pentapeptide repeats